MIRHTGEGHAEALAALGDGAADARAAFARSELAKCPACERLLELEGELDALGAGERRSLAERGAAEPEGPAERALRERVLDTARPARAATWRRLAPVLVLAAAAAVLYVLVSRWNVAGPPSDPRLGDGFELEHPLGLVSDFDSFRWTPAPEAAWYRVVVQSLDPEANGARTESGRVFETRWQPSGEERERWGKTIRWTVEVYRATSATDVADSESASAERSSR